MKGFIYAAGFGERLRPITGSVPKALVPVLNVASISYPLMLLKEAGIRDVICNLHYRHNDIIQYFKDNDFFGFNISFSFEDKILGTGGGLKKCERELSDDYFIVLNSDVIIDIDLREVVDFAGKAGLPAAVVLHKTEKAREIGPVGVRDGEIIDFKNFLNTGVMSNYIYSGVAVLSPLIFKYLSEEFSSVVYTAYIEMIKNHGLKFFSHDKFWEDIGSIESYWNVNMSMIKNKHIFSGRMLKTLNQKMEIISGNAVVNEASVIKNSVIGRHCIISEGAAIENSVVFPNSVIRDVVILNSIVDRDNIYKI
ncbi:MAG: NDP-sugar synthase [Spirochaetes bacterium]|nr:NDP-sugar synthase [Spirochaetota bacterium]